MEKLTNDTITLKLKSLFYSSDEDSILPTKPAITLILILGITAAIFQFRPPQQSNVKKEVGQWNLDTFIPEGESLVPIKVSNYESLDQIIGQYGVVDLFSTPLSHGEKAKRVAYAVKLVRSPKSPHHFSVLTSADEAHRLAGFHGEFTVVVRNPKLIGTKFEKDKSPRPKRRVVFEMENQ